MFIISSYLIIFLLIFEKYQSINWINKIGKLNHKFKNFDKNQKYFYIRRFVNYTTVASYLALLSSLYTTIYGKLPDSYFMVLIWNQTFTITLGYWLIVFPELLKSEEPKNYLLDFMQHGPVLVLYTNNISNISNNNNLFNINELIHSILFGYFYLFFIWTPYNLITGDTIYHSMNGNWINKLLTISKINLLCIIGHIIGYLFLN